MTYRKCATCRYYQDAEVACSGWCTHPERGDLQDLVLVRRWELACRNVDDDDLWEEEPVPRLRDSRRFPVLASGGMYGVQESYGVVD